MSVVRKHPRFAPTAGSAVVWMLSVLGLVALGWLFYFLANLGPRSVKTKTVAVRADDPAVAKAAAEVDALERVYKLAVAADSLTPAARTALEEAVTRQRELVRMYPKATVEQSVRLGRLEGELASIHAREMLTQIDDLEKDAEKAVADKQPDLAVSRYQEALRLQRAVNGSGASQRYKNYVRETSLLQALATLAAEPLSREITAAVDAARLAAAEQRWGDALAAFIAAREVQTRINREYPRTRFADLAAADRLDGEIASLNAAGIVSEIDGREKRGDAEMAAGRPAQAATFYEEAHRLQTQLNEKFQRSRFVSSARLEELEAKRQTSLSIEGIERLTVLDQEIAEHLRKRQIVAAEQKLAEAGELVETTFTRYPRSRRLDGAIRIKLAFLALRRSDLRAFQDEVYDRLLPLPGVEDRFLLKTELPQALYVLVMNTNPSRNPGRALPVDSVSWQDAQEFCTRLSWLLGVPVRLPTADEFRVALGGSGEVGAWSAENSAATSHDAGKLASNAAGFFDLLGNLAEWLAAAPTTSNAQVAGGSYLDNAQALLRVPVESREKSERARHIGFRFLVTMTLP